MARRAEFLQNNELWINQSVANRDLEKLGPGWFHWIDGGVNFIPKKPSDPTAPSVHYSIISPTQFKPRVAWLLGSLLLSQLLLYNRFCRHRPQLRFLSPNGLFCGDSTAPSWCGEALLLGFALVAIFTSLHTHRDLTDHAFMVKGIPESDASAWFTMAVGLAEGEGLKGGFQNQRPFYPTFLAALFSFFGVKLSLAQGFNAICLAFSVAGVYSIGRLLHTRWLGLVLAVGSITATTHLDYVHAIITENGGNVFALLSLLSAWLAAWILSPRWAFLAGLVNGLAALTSGVTLLTLPLYLLIIVAFPIARRVPWRRALLIGLFYTLGATLTVGPWIARQKIVNNRLTLSFNTAEVLAGGADLTHGRLSKESFLEAQSKGTNLSDANQRYEYFINQYLQSISANPLGYLRQLGRAFLASVDYLPSKVAGFQLTLLLGLFGFGLWPALQRGQWLAVPFAGLLMFLWARSHFDVTPLMLLAATFLAWRRNPLPATRLVIALLVATTLATMILAALSGNVATKRFWLVADWAPYAILLTGTKYFVVSAAALSHRLLARTSLPGWISGSPDFPPLPGAAMSPPPFIALSTFAWLSFSALCAATTLSLSLRGPQPPFSIPIELSLPAIADSGLKQAQAAGHRLPDVPPDQLSIHLARLGDLHATLKANEGTQHWIQIYAERPYPRWVAKFTLLNSNGTSKGYVNAIGQDNLLNIPKNTPIIVVGVLSHSINRINLGFTPLLETLLIIPLARPNPQSPWEPDFSTQTPFPPTPEALSTLP
jgi:4-amino-4-deoxy-L-arabinose transferase-like glycosyltransferase